jgi:hypothetical protein
MAKKKATTDGTIPAAADTPLESSVAPVASDPVALTYVGPRDAESPRYGALVPGRVYQEADAAFATYLVETHPDHWARA